MIYSFSFKVYQPFNSKGYQDNKKERLLIVGNYEEQNGLE